MLADRARMGSGSEKFDPSTWEGIQNIVRKGKATNFFSVGDELVSLYTGEEIIWQVIGIDVDTPSDSNFTHSMTIQTKDIIENISWGTDSMDNRYINSYIRSFLNDSFLRYVDPELSAVIGQVNKKVAVRNAIGGQDSFSDKVFLLSRKEVDLGDEGVTTGEFVYPFYNGKGNVNRIKNTNWNGNAWFWWLRSPDVPYSRDAGAVNMSGTLITLDVEYSYGVSPACVII